MLYSGFVCPVSTPNPDISENMSGETKHHMIMLDVRSKSKDEKNH